MKYFIILKLIFGAMSPIFMDGDRDFLMSCQHCKESSKIHRIAFQKDWTRFSPVKKFLSRQKSFFPTLKGEAIKAQNFRAGPMEDTELSKKGTPILNFSFLLKLDSKEDPPGAFSKSLIQEGTFLKT